MEPTAVDSEFGVRGRERRQLLFQISALTTLALALVALLLLWLLRKSDLDVPLIAAAVTQSATRYDSDPLFAAPNPYAQEDLELMQDRFGGNTNQHLKFVGSLSDQSGPMRSSDGEELIRRLTGPLENVVPGGRDGKMITMFVTAQGLVHDNQPYLLMGDSLPQETSSWVRVESLFEGIMKELKEHKDVPDCRVVLFLDATRSLARWDWGNFDQTFASHCRDVASRVAPNRLAVILSSNDGERSWCDPRKGRSLFAHSIVEALTGYGDGDGNGTVTVGEIEDYLRSQVSSSAQAIWAASQHPVLLTENAREWRLIRQPQRYKSPTPASQQEVADNLRKEIEDNFSKIDALWDRHNAAARMRHSPLATNPADWSTLEKQLARLDQLALAGKGHVAERDQLLASCDQLLGQIENGSDLIPTQHQLPELRLVEYFHGEHELSEGEKQFTQDWEKNHSADKAQLPPDFGSELEVTGILWRWLSKQGFDQDSMTAAAGLIDLPKLNLNVPVSIIETHLLRLLSADDLQHVRGPRATAILRALNASRDAILTPDLRASFWIREQAERLDLARMSNVDALLARGESKRADEELQRCIGDYAKLRDDGVTISSGYRLRDEILHGVPRMTETLLADVEAFAEEERSDPTAPSVGRATSAARCLAASLRLADVSQAPTAPETLRQITDVMRKAEQSINELREKLDGRVELVTGMGASDESGLRQAVALLQGSGISDAEQRQRIHQRLVEILAIDSTELRASSEGGGVAAPASSADVLDWLTIRDQHPWVYWMNQTKLLSCGEVSAESANAGPRDLSAQGAEVRQAIADLLQGPKDFSSTRSIPAQLTKEGKRLAIVRQSVEDIETSVRSQTFLLTSSPPSIAQAVEDRFALDLQLFMMDQAGRTLREFWCEARNGEEPFFVGATEKLLSYQRRSDDSNTPKLDRVLDGKNLSDRLAEATRAALDPVMVEARPTGNYAGGVLVDEIPDEPIQFEVARSEALPRGNIAVWTETQTDLLPITEPGSTPLPTSLLVKNLKETDDWFEVDSLFRGMRRTGRLRIRHKGEPQTTVFRLPNYETPKATVKTEKDAPERIILVLDCSASMKDPIGGEDVEEKLTAARKAVNSFVQWLELTIPDSSIGLIQFGHRYGWLTYKQGDEIPPGSKVGYLVPGSKIGGKQLYKVEVVGQEGSNTELALDDEGADKNPNFDVEVVVPLGKLSIQGTLVKNSVATAFATGVTPTYQAILRAYEELGNSPGHIIVLTDGEPLLPGAVEIQKEKLALAQAVAREDVRLSVINFATKLQADQEQEFLTIAGVKLYTAKDGKELSEVLQSTISRNKFVWKHGDERVSGIIEPGRYIAIDRDMWPPPERKPKVAAGQPVRPPEEYRFESDVPKGERPVSVKLPVEGGEAFELQLQGEELRHVPFPRNYHPDRELLMGVDGAGRNRYSVLALPPNRNKDRDLELRLVIENADPGKFTPRPSDVWIELTGSDSRNVRKIRFSINSCEFEAPQPVPVLLCRVDWPDWATSNVQIDAWLRFADPVAPRTELPLDKPDRFTLGSVDSVDFLVETDSSDREFQVSITERHERGELDRLRIMLEPLPLEAVTRLYPEESRVERVYRYLQRPTNLRAYVTTKDQITEGATLYVRGTAPPIRN